MKLSKISYGAIIVGIVTLAAGGTAVLADAPIVVAHPAGNDSTFDVFDASGSRIGGASAGSGFNLAGDNVLRLGDWNGDFFDEVNLAVPGDDGGLSAWDQSGDRSELFRRCDNTGNFCELQADCRSGSDLGACRPQLDLTPSNSSFDLVAGNAMFLADLNGDGVDEFVVARRSFDPTLATFSVFNRRGQLIAGGNAASDFAYGDDVFDKYFIGAADTDGDGVDEIFVTVATFNPDDARFDLYDISGSRVGGSGDNSDFRMGTGSPADRYVFLAADMDGDGADEMVVAVGTFGPADAFFDRFDASGNDIGGAGADSDFFLGVDDLDQFRVLAGDVDGDGRDEIVVAITPLFNPDGATFDIFDESGNDEGGADGDSDFHLGGEDTLLIGAARFSPLTAADDDADGDGLFDVWETEGVQVGSSFLDLPALNADPMHKDLFLEMDWMDGRPPNQRTIRELVRAFALAPVDNPDGTTGIRLWVDTGDLQVGREDGGAPGNSCRDGMDNGNEDGAGPGTCSDGIDNGVDGLIDAGDPDCDGKIDGADPDCQGVEDDFLSSSCFDGIDNGPDGARDALDEDCPKIEDGVGPETCFDGMDNGGDGLADAQDPDCHGMEDGVGLSACIDGIDNGPDGDGADGLDADCLVGHDLGGGNVVPFANVSQLTEAFYEIKSANFDPARRPAFHYVLMARFPANNQGTSTGGNEINTLNDTNQAWTPNEWIDGVLTVTEGTGLGQERTVISNSVSQLVLSDPEELRGFSNTCGNGFDEDGDGLFDDDDPDCQTPDETSAYAISIIGGQAEIVGNDVVVFNQRSEDMSTMHELGHNLGLHHGGDVEQSCKPNYVSVMNYDFPFGIPQNRGGYIIDYSPPRHALGRGAVPAQLDETDLDESVILDPGDPANRFVYASFTPDGREDGQGAGSCSDGINNGTDLVADGLDPDCVGVRVQAPLNGDLDDDGPGDGDADGLGDGVDWNADGQAPNDSMFVLNIDTAGANGLPAICLNRGAGPVNGYDDWANIEMNFRPAGEASDAAVNPVATPEPNDLELEEVLRQLNTTNLSVALSSAPDPVEAGDDLVYTIVVKNHGPNPAGTVLVDGSPPGAAELLGISGGCADDGSGSVVCLSAELLSGAERGAEMTVSTTGTCSDGVPASLTAAATVANAAGFAGADLEPGDNADSLTVTPVDTTPPELTVPDPLVLECNVAGGVFADDAAIVDWIASASASDVCDGEPAVTDDAPEFFFSGCSTETGTTTVTFTATDESGNTVSETSTVTVLDRTPPTVVLDPISTCLWSPDGEMRDVTAFTTVDVCDPLPWSAAVVTSDEATSVHCPDADLVEPVAPTGIGSEGVVVGGLPGAPDVIRVRAERNGLTESGDGRVYGAVGVRGTDVCGNSATTFMPVDILPGCSGAVCVPHDQDPKTPRKKKGAAPPEVCPATDGGQVHDATVCD